MAPIAVDVTGLIRLSNALTRVEERLSVLVGNSGHYGEDNSGLLALVGADHHHAGGLLIPEQLSETDIVYELNIEYWSMLHYAYYYSIHAR